MKKVINNMTAMLFCIFLLMGTFSELLISAGAVGIINKEVGEDSGTVGSCTWFLDDYGNLTIKGYGSMGDFDGSSPDWGRSIRTVNIMNGVTSIGPGAFSACENLTYVSIPESVVRIENNAFVCCTNLTSISIPKSVSYIGEWAFAYCEKMSYISLPNEIKSIGAYAFVGCNSLKQALFPKGISTIPEGMFRQCSSLTEVVIPDYITEIGDLAFCSCNKLKKVFIPDSVENIGNYSFNGCSALTGVNIPEHIKKIPDGTFSYCGISSIKLPDNLTEIGYMSFNNCNSLKTITIPKTVTKIGSNAFSGYSSLNRINYLGTKSEWEKVTLGDNAILNAPVTYYYDIKETYKFGNRIGKIEEKIYDDIFGKNTLKAKRIRKIDNGTGGQCFGMVCTAMGSSIYDIPGVLTYSKDSQISSTGKLFDINYDWISESTGTSAAEYIKYGQIFQYTSTIQKQEETNRQGIKSNYSDLILAVNRFMYGNDPVLIAIRGEADGRKCGHALWALGVGESNSDFTEIRVYDCERPRFEQKLILYKDNKGNYTSWEYEMPQLNTVWGSEQEYSDITFSTPAKDFALLYAQNIMYEDNSYMNIFSASDDSFSLYDDQHNAVNVKKCDTNKVIPIYSTSGNNLEIDDSYNYWINLGNDFSVYSYGEKSDYTISGEKSEVGVSLPYKGQAKFTFNDSDYNKVLLELEEKGKIALSYSRINKIEDMDSINFFGLGEKDIYTEETEGGFFVEGIENLFVTVNENIKVNFSDIDCKKKTFITFSEKKIRAFEDSDNDGVFEKEIYPDTTVVSGDVNCDGEVNINDVTALQCYIAKITDLSNEQLTAADTNGDGVVNIIDATRIQKYLAKLIKEL